MISLDQITLLISIINLIAALIAWLYIIFHNRKKYEIIILSYSFGEKGLLAYVQLINFSRLPISITDISLTSSEILFPCQKVPGIALTETIRQYNKITLTKDYDLTVPPITLSALSAISGYLFFPNHPSNQIGESNCLTFLISSNRGHQDQRTLSLHLANKLKS